MAIELNVQEIFLNTRGVEEIITKLKSNENGKIWLQSMDNIKDPWFYFNSGTGFYHTSRSWIDDLSVPFSAIKGYINRLQNGEDIERNQEEIKKQAEKLKDGYCPRHTT